MLLILTIYIIYYSILTVAPSFDHFIVNSHLLRPLYLSYTDTTYAWFSFLCVPNLHSTSLKIHFTIYYVSWRVWFLDLQAVTYIFYLIFILPFSFSFFSLIAMIPLISPLCISLLSSCFQMLLLSSLSSWCYSSFVVVCHLISPMAVYLISPMAVYLILLSSK